MWDETAGGWLLTKYGDMLMYNEYPELVVVDLARVIKNYNGDPTHTYTVQPFIVPGPGELSTERWGVVRGNGSRVVGICETSEIAALRIMLPYGYRVVRVDATAEAEQAGKAGE